MFSVRNVTCCGGVREQSQLPGNPEMWAELTQSVEAEVQAGRLISLSPPRLSSTDGLGAAPFSVPWGTRAAVPLPPWAHLANVT